MTNYNKFIIITFVEKLTLPLDRQQLTNGLGVSRASELYRRLYTFMHGPTVTSGCDTIIYDLVYDVEKALRALAEQKHLSYSHLTERGWGVDCFDIKVVDSPEYDSVTGEMSRALDAHSLCEEHKTIGRLVCSFHVLLMGITGQFAIAAPSELTEKLHNDKHGPMTTEELDAWVQWLAARGNMDRINVGDPVLQKRLDRFHTQLVKFVDFYNDHQEQLLRSETTIRQLLDTLSDFFCGIKVPEEGL